MAAAGTGAYVVTECEWACARHDMPKKIEASETRIFDKISS